MEGASNGGMLYHEVQESKLCAVHCVNTVLQGPFFSELDFAALASDLDRRERQMMNQSGGDFLPDPHVSHNVSLDGDFSIQVLQKALEVWDLQVIPLDSPVAEQAKMNPELENAFICNLQSHWFCIRKVNGEWYNFDSLYAAPEHLSKFYLSAYLSSLKGSGWSIFLVRGNFPKECPMASSDATYGYGQWLSPEDAERITKSCNSSQRFPGSNQPVRSPDPYLQYADDGDLFLEEEDEDLKAAIAASLLDSAKPTATPSPVPATMPTPTPTQAPAAMPVATPTPTPAPEPSPSPAPTASLSPVPVEEAQGNRTIETKSTDEIENQVRPQDEIADVVLWRRKNLTAGILVATLAAWLVFEKSGYTLVSWVSSVLFLLLTILFVWSKSAAIVNRPAPPLPHLHLSEEMVNDAAVFIRDNVNNMLAIAEDIALGKDSIMFAKVSASLLLISIIGSFTDLFTLAYASLLLLLTVPAIYEKYEDVIDVYAFSGYKTLGILYERLDKKCISKVSSMILDEKKAS
ncbi:OLC1v1035015C1 [Oldenlandia corymbosa var. corymbosa]|uniref:Reticulon-like protein n=1 Tax=Oldenlandia corymbosa var. corymbosa TaxID=529605 RepID=A0AAV1CV64_OLDCO|nr:OLC1v1035015C1 [Oldenlandia corymbosa var. corymbosa]